MTDLIVALGLVFVIEGLLWALFPHYAMRILEAAKEMGEQGMRMSGLISVGLGFLLVWFIRG